METLLFIILTFLHSYYATLVCPDSYSSYSRTDCGYIGITQNECITPTIKKNETKQLKEILLNYN